MGELLFRKKYRVPSARLGEWDYSQNGYYFITICTKGGKHQFGEIKNGNMCLYRTGSVAWEYWLDIPNHFHHVYLDQFIVMPNHIHMVVHIDHGQASRFETCDECKRWCGRRRGMVVMATDGGELQTSDLVAQSVETGQCPVSTPTPSTIQIPSTMDTQSQRGSISVIVGSYKSVVTKNINQLFDEHNVKQKFTWQSRFYDRVIRSERELYNVREYIKNNPTKWWRDRNNTRGIFM